MHKIWSISLKGLYLFYGRRNIDNYYTIASLTLNFEVTAKMNLVFIFIKNR